MLCLIVHAVNLVRHGSRRDIDLAANDRLDSGSLGSAVKVDHAVHNAVVGNGNRILPKL